ncbi:ABC transporter permease subunit [Duganella sp. FT92W]|uniref:ABC transporter permease subunit n=1 Tax=Pseudoduganella rivuli TaxID=2666085 RepID=A0A7X2IL09_9BURK|nr:ABC transporter permease subunit [Pseudoduganella rivuli]MRV71800.1 ABC transporter permease subunit [Pseudoduganella rivuli]
MLFNPAVQAAAVRPNRYDLALLPLLAALLAAAMYGAVQMAAPLASSAPVALAPHHLPYYLLRTLLRMFAALGCSLLFTFAFAVAANRYPRVGKALLPLLDVLQSVPVLGFQAIAVAPFIALFPGSVLGAECAAIFAIFSSQAWNMAFSLYHSIRTVPPALQRAARRQRMNGWQRFWRIELPHGAQPLLWNMMMSMSGGWFFLVASEVITVAGRDIRLPGIGAWIAAAIEQRDMIAIAWAMLAMLAGIVLYDQLLFRPLLAWTSRMQGNTTQRRTWLMNWVRRGAWTRVLAGSLYRGLAGMPGWYSQPPATAGEAAARWAGKHAAHAEGTQRNTPRAAMRHLRKFAPLAAGFACAVAAAWALSACATLIEAECGWRETAHVAWLGLLTLLRVLVPVALVSLFWVPFSIWAGLRPRRTKIVQGAAQWLAALPLNLLFPLAAVALATFRLNPDIWLSVLLVAGTQWYILFNVMAGAATLPEKQVAGLTRWQTWRGVYLPAVAPHCVTGMLTACGGSWNASVVAEYINWGDTTVTAHGLGSYIRQMTDAGDMPRLALGIAVMCIYVVALNHTLWRGLYRLADRRQPALTFANGTGTAVG